MSDTMKLAWLNLYRPCAQNSSCEIVLGHPKGPLNGRRNNFIQNSSLAVGVMNMEYTW